MCHILRWLFLSSKHGDVHMIRRFASLFVVAATAAACGEPLYPEFEHVPQLATGRSVTAAAHGGGKAVLPPGFSALSFSFTANQHADGSASGEFHQLYESAGGIVDFRGTVTCLSSDSENGRAWIGGVITQNRSTNPAVQGEIHQPGHDVWFRVVDNGEGNSAVDRTTVFGFEGGGGITTSAQYCNSQPWTAGDANTWAVASGNIQVR
jgi:hypothetical protein